MMTRLKTSGSTAVLLLGLLAASPAHALSNGSFETGTQGWAVTIPTGESELGLGQLPAGTVETTAHWQLGEGIEQTPVDGTMLLAVGSACCAFFVVEFPLLTYDITVTQPIALEAGDTLAGWVSFFNGDFEAQDTGWVRILDAEGLLVATPWSEVSGALSSGGLPYLTLGSWQPWAWTALEPGSYTLVLGVRTFGDNRFDSYALFDGVTVRRRADAVPEPPMRGLVLLGLVVAGLLLVRRWERTAASE